MQSARRRPMTAGLSLAAVLLALCIATPAAPAATWAVQGFSTEVTSSFGMLGVSCASASACTSVSTGLVVRWNGRSWSTQSFPLYEEEEAILRSVSCVSGTACTTVGDAWSPRTGTYLAVAGQWNGREWSVAEAANPERQPFRILEAVSCKATSCTAVGDYENGALLLTLAERWNGERWSVQTTPNAGVDDYLSDVSCPTESMCMATGESGLSPLSEQWDGRTWTIKSVPVPRGATISRLDGVSCFSEASCLAVGIYEEGLGSYWAFSVKWNGREWQLVEVPRPSGSRERESSLASVSCPTATFCTAAGRRINEASVGQTFATQWNGSTWSTVETPNPEGTLESRFQAISCASATSCIGVGRNWSRMSGILGLFERYS